MADDIRLVIKVVGTEGIVEATNKTLSLESNVKKLSSAYSRGSLSYSKYRKGLSELSSEFGKTEAELKRYANNLRSSERALEREKAASAALRQELHNLTRARREAADMNRRANEQARLEREALEQSARSARTAAQARRQLRMEFSAGYTAMVQFRAASLRLSSAQRQGIISAEEYAIQLARLRAELDNAGGAAQRGGRHMSRSGVMTQQFGYQMGDFLVQVQGGTNALVAFGQQATQMVGALYMLPRAILATTIPILGMTISVVALIAAAGILIPLITAIGAYFMRARAAARDAKKEISLLEQGLKSLDSTLAQWVQSKRAASMGITVAEMLGGDGLAKAKKDLADTSKLLEDMKADFDGFAVLSTGDFVGYALKRYGISKAETAQKAALLELEKATLRVTQQGTMQTEDQLANGAKEFDNLQGQLELQKAIGRYGEGSTQAKEVERQQSIKAYNEEIDLAVELGDYAAGYGETLKLHNKILSDRIPLQEASLSFVEKLTEAVELAAKEDEKRIADAVKVNELVSKEIILLTQRTLLAQEAKRLGVDSAEYKALELKTTLENYRAEQLSNGVKDEALSLLVDMLATAIDTEDVLADWTVGIDAAAKSLDNVLSKVLSIYSAVNSIGFDTIGVKAELAARKAGNSKADARAIGQNASDVAAINANPDFGGANGSISKGLALDGLRVELAETIKLNAEKAKLDAYEDSLKPAKGGGSKKEKDSTLEKLLEEQALRKDLLGLFGQERILREEVGAVTKALGDEAIGMSAAQIEGLAKLNLELANQEELQKQALAGMQSVADVMSSSMGEAFTSMVDGTKSFSDAMKDMARAVIKQLFEILVVQRLVGSFNNTSGVGSGIVGAILKPFSSPTAQANGGAWSGGSQINAYAKGGVVSSPTYFPMSGGETGLMGEAGPEAIMPLKRGKDGKLGVSSGGGGSQSVVVNQSFSFQANGDESVKRIIAQAAPSISAMAQKGIMDQRRRGGAVKSTFG